MYSRCFKTTLQLSRWCWSTLEYGDTVQVDSAYDSTCVNGAWLRNEALLLHTSLEQLGLDSFLGREKQASLLNSA